MFLQKSRNLKKYCEKLGGEISVALNLSQNP